MNSFIGMLHVSGCDAGILVCDKSLRIQCAWLIRALLAANCLKVSLS